MDCDAVLGIVLEIAIPENVWFLLRCETTTQTLVVTRVPHEHDSTQSLALQLCPDVPSYTSVPVRFSVSMSAPNVSNESVRSGTGGQVGDRRGRALQTSMGWLATMALTPSPCRDERNINSRC